MASELESQRGGVGMLKPEAEAAATALIGIELDERERVFSREIAQIREEMGVLGLHSSSAVVQTIESFESEGHGLGPAAAYEREPAAFRLTTLA